MTYTIKNAAMTLGSAKAVMAEREHYNADQIARAAAVIRYWKNRRATAAKMQTARVALAK